MNFLPEGLLRTKKCTSKFSIASGKQWEGQVRRNALDIGDFFYNIRHLHIGRWWPKSTFPTFRAEVSKIVF
jgi:hypothetical protein